MVVIRPGTWKGLEWSPRKAMCQPELKLGCSKMGCRGQTMRGMCLRVGVSSGVRGAFPYRHPHREIALSASTVGKSWADKYPELWMSIQPFRGPWVVGVRENLALGCCRVSANTSGPSWP